MQWVTGSIAAFWILLAVTDQLLKGNRSLSKKYRLFLDRYGLFVSLGRLQWYTSRANKFLVQSSNFLPYQWQRAWFTAGAVTGVFLVPLSVGLLTFTLFSFIESPTSDTKGPVLVPVMPGVNLPWNQLLYFLITITISGILHEFGHAIAAVSEGVRIDGVGLFFFVLYPGAYVNLHTQHVTLLKPMQKLQVFCAGVWHNMVIVLLSLFALYCLPWILLPLFTTGKGAIIDAISENSPVYGQLLMGSEILSVDGSPVDNRRDWTSSLLESHQHGFCANKRALEDNYVTVISTTDSGIIECCRNDSLSDFCFYTDESRMEGNSKKYFCLNARQFTTGLHCVETTDCFEPEQSVCLHPSLDDQSRLFRIAHNGPKDVIFVGHPLLLYQSISLTDYHPRINFFLLYQLPRVTETFLLYFISLSSALGLLNSMPAYFLDGQWIVTALIDYFFRTWNAETRNKLTSTVLAMGSILLLSNMVLGLYAILNTQ